MRKFLAVFALAGALCACTPFDAGGVNSAPPAPLAETSFDEHAIDLGIDAVELSLHALDAGIAAGTIKPKSPKALKIAELVDKARNALNAAAAAREALSATDYATAMRQASSALTQLKLTF